MTKSSSWGEVQQEARLDAITCHVTKVKYVLAISNLCTLQRQGLVSHKFTGNWVVEHQVLLVLLSQLQLQEAQGLSIKLYGK